MRRWGDTIFTVAAILNEPLATTARFAAWYVSQGAAQVRIFFDNPDDPAIAALGRHPRVACIPCTDDFWSGIGLDRSVRFAKRQNAALTQAYRDLQDGWLLNVDGDEFLYFQDRTIAEAVETIDPALNAVCIRTAEAAGSDGTGGRHDFRLPMGRQQVRHVYGPDAGMFARRSGMVGHDTGKSLIRAGQNDIRLRQHWAEHVGGGRVEGPTLGAEEGAYLLHFADAGYPRWRAKVDWRLRSSGFHPRIKARIEQVLAADDPEAGLEALHANLHGLGGDRLARLKELDRHLEVAVDFDAVAASVFPDLANS